MHVVLDDLKMSELLIYCQEKASHRLDIGVVDANHFLLAIVFEVTEAICCIKSIHWALGNWTFDIYAIDHS